MIELFGIDKVKLEKFLALIDMVDYDPETKTLTIDQSITIKVKGDYKLETDRHVMISSNFMEIDPELELPFSVFFNSPEIGLKNIQKNLEELLGKTDDEDCGCHQ